MCDSQNENRYNVGKGTHLVLKRAEKARALVSKKPGECTTMLILFFMRNRRFYINLLS